MKNGKQKVNKYNITVDSKSKEMAQTSLAKIYIYK